MLKKTITFEDLDGNKISEDFYFNLSKAEIAEMELSQKGGLIEYIQKIVKEEDGAKLVELFKGLIVNTVGKRSDDGRRFIKSQEIRDDFTQTNAYSELFMELVTNSDSAAEFVNGIVPASLENDPRLKELAAKTTTTEQPATTADVPDWLNEGRTPTPDEVRNATPEQLQMAFARKQNDLAQTPTPPSA